MIIELGSRRMVHFGVTRNPTDEWTAQQLREATSFAGGPRFLIRDNDRKYGSLFERAGSGIELLRRTRLSACLRQLVARSLASHAVCERFLGSVRRVCLDHFVILHERHLHRLFKEYEAYFHGARPNQGIEQRVPCRTERLDAPPVTATLSSRPVLNGLHHDYSWRAARSAEQNQGQFSTRH